MATHTAVGWPAGWRRSSAAATRYTYDTAVTESPVVLAEAGLWIRSYTGSSDTSAVPTASDVGVPLSSIPTDGTAVLRIVGENTGAEARPAPRFAGFNRATQTGYAPPGTTTVLGWPTLAPGAFDSSTPVTETVINATKTAFGGGDQIDVFLVMSLPEGRIDRITLEWPVEDPPAAQPVTGVRRMTLWDGSGEVGIAADALSSAALHDQTPPFQPIPQIAALWPTQATTPVRVMSWGDSQTDGTSAGAGGTSSWPSLLSAALTGSAAQRMPADSVQTSTTVQAPSSGVKWVNNGFGGSTAASFAPEPLRALAKKFQPQVITIQVGVNDCLQGVAIDTYRENLAGAVDAALSASATTEVVVIASWEAASMRGKKHTWAEYRTAMREVAQSSSRCAFLDAASFYAAGSLPSNDGGGWLASDSLHFTAAGHQVHAELVGAALGIPYERPRAAAAGPGAVVIGPSDSVPPGTPAGTLVIRRLA